MVGAFFLFSNFKEMKAIRFFMVLLSATLLCGCNSDDDNNNSVQNVPQGLIGTWGGSKTISSTGSERSLIVTFKTDMTGDLTYESSSYYRYAAFNYTVSGNTINCYGVMVGEDGNVNENWSMTFEYHENYLRPLDAYTDITLYKAGYESGTGVGSNSEYEEKLSGTTWKSLEAHGGSVTFFSDHTLYFQDVSNYYTSGEWSLVGNQLEMMPDNFSSNWEMTMAIYKYYPLASATIVELTNNELQLKDSTEKIYKYTKK